MKGLENIKKVKVEALVGLSVFMLVVVVAAGGIFFLGGSAVNNTQVATSVPDMPPTEENTSLVEEVQNALQGPGLSYSLVPVWSSNPVNPQKPSSPQNPVNPSGSDDDELIEIPWDELPDDIKDELFPGWDDDEEQGEDEDELWDFPEAEEEELDPDDVETPEDEDGFPEDGPQEENPDQETPEVPDDIGETEEPDPLEDEGEFPEDVPEDVPDDDWINDWING